MTPVSPILVTRDLAAKRSWRTVFSGITLDLVAGDRLYLVGENGAGKTTLLETILGLHPAAAGQVTWLGRLGTPATHQAFLKGAAVYLPQHQNVFPSLTLRENILVGSGPLARRTLDEIVATLPELAPALHRKPGQVSAGQRQLAACARAAVRRPRLLVLDEPTAGLAADLFSRVYALFERTLSDETAVIFTEQHTQHAQSWATRCFRLADGVLQPNSREKEGAAVGSSRSR